MAKPLNQLLQELQSARAALAEQRNLPTVPGRLEVAREATLAALEDYVDALERNSLPIPYALRDELRLARDCRPTLR